MSIRFLVTAKISVWAHLAPGLALRHDEVGVVRKAVDDNVPDLGVCVVLQVVDSQQLMNDL